MTPITNSKISWTDLPNLVGLTVAYALLAKIVLGFFSANGIISIVWPPSGLALAALLMGGKKLWPGVFAGALIGNVISGSPIVLSFAIAFGNTLEALACVWLLEYRGDFDHAFNKSRDYWMLVLAAAIGAIVSALNGCIALMLAGVLSWGALPYNLLTWWRGDFLGIVLLTPLLIVWRRWPLDWFVSTARVAESVVFFALAFVFGQAVFLDWLHGSLGQIARGYWMFLFVVWAAVRFGRHGTMLIVSMVAVQALLGAVSHTGFFATDIANTGLSNFWFYMLILTVVGISLAIVMGELRQMRKVAQANLERLNEAQRIAEVGNWTLDIGSGHLYWSDEIYRLFEIDPAKFGATYAAFLNAIHPDDREAVNQAYTRSLETREPYEISHRLLMADGRIKWVDERCETIYDEQGKSSRSTGTVQEITRRKLIEIALAQSNTDLERFAYSVSHDMRQPLRAVSGHLQLLQRSLQDKLNEDERENLGFALEGAKRMDSMIVSLLDYSRVGRKTESMQMIAGRESLDEALAILGPAIRQAHAEIKVSGEWPQVFASRDELTRLFQNLIGNALHYHEPDQAPQVEVVSAVGTVWRVSVRDHGIGINAQQMDRLFQFFSRLQSRARFEGTGMGLALCRRIVDHHHGRIWAESEGEGKGSAFIFELPLNQAEGGLHEP